MERERSPIVHVVVRQVSCKRCGYQLMIRGLDETIDCPKYSGHGPMEDVAVSAPGKLTVDVCPKCGFAVSHDGPDDKPNPCPVCPDKPDWVLMLIVALGDPA